MIEDDIKYYKDKIRELTIPHLIIEAFEADLEDYGASKKLKLDQFKSVYVVTLVLAAICDKLKYLMHGGCAVLSWVSETMPANAHCYSAVFCIDLPPGKFYNDSYYIQIYVSLDQVVKFWTEDTDISEEQLLDMCFNKFRWDITEPVENAGAYNLKELYQTLHTAIATDLGPF